MSYPVDRTMLLELSTVRTHTMISPRLSTGGAVGANSMNESATEAVRYALLDRVLARSVEPDSRVFEIARWLGSAIIEGTLAPGSSISSVDIAQRVGSSRAPARDALFVLEREGLIDTGIGRAARVKHLSLDEVREIYDVRASLHAMAAERVVLFASDAELAGLRALHERLEAMAAASDFDGYFWSNVELRDREIVLSKNRLARQLLDSLGLRTLLIRHQILSLPNRLEQSAKAHGDLISAYESRNAMLAVALARTILADGLRGIEESGWTGDPSTGHSGLLKISSQIASEVASCLQEKATEI